MSTTTITEALAELKTLDKRLTKKRQFVKDYLFRQGHIRDPHEKDGGSFAVLKRERQAIADLEARKVLIRSAINAKNAATVLTLGERTLSVADWIIWRRDVAPLSQTFLGELRNGVNDIRKQSAAKGLTLVADGAAQNATDVVININEKELAESIESMETVLGDLDGKLSLLNATTTVNI